MRMRNKKNPGVEHMISSGCSIGRSDDNDIILDS